MLRVDTVEIGHSLLQLEGIVYLDKFLFSKNLLLVLLSY
jgi:hypothetical protein